MIRSPTDGELFCIAALFDVVGILIGGGIVGFAWLIS